jgi:hypothetical protein
MDTHKNLSAENEVANLFYKKEATHIAEKKDKRTLDEEADLTAQEVEQMEQDTAKENYVADDPKGKGQKGSSGPEEKDIAV